MQTEFKNFKDGMYFVPLGGCSEIGRNLNVFGSIKNKKEEWVIVDIGISIGKGIIRVECPKFDFLMDKNIVGVVCTHGHDDHIGGLAIIIPTLDAEMKKRDPNHNGIPIYATPFTMDLIKLKFEEIGYSPNLITVYPSKIFNVQNYEFELIYITHSIAEPNMVRFKCNTHNYNILHTGDWKFDTDPIVGETTDLDYIRKLGDDGVDLLLCDSTNALEEEYTPPEGMVKVNLRKLIKEYYNNRIVISCFSSNIARLSAISSLAKEFNKHLVGAGSSILKMWRVAKDHGYIPKEAELYSVQDLKKLDPKKVIMVCTGSQGEKGAVLNRLAYGDRPPFILTKNDIVVFSSRKIPGNEKEIDEMQSSLIRRGVKIIDSKSFPGIHVSGHPSSQEVAQMISLVRPLAFIPVHGYAKHFDAMLTIAEKAGISRKLMPYNGAVIDLKAIKIVGNIVYGLMGVDGKQLIDMESKVMVNRNMLRDHGIINISFSNSTKPSLSNFGCIPDELFKDCIRPICDIVKESARNLRSDNRKAVIGNIIYMVNEFFRRKFGKNPVICVHIL